MIARTPKASYYAVIFSSLRTEEELNYAITGEEMVRLAKKQKGFLGIESARSEIGITVSYWEDLAAIKDWKMQVDHTEARERGNAVWYRSYKVRICKVERDYEFEK